MPIKNLATSFKQQPKWKRISIYFISAYFFYAVLIGLIAPLFLLSITPDKLSDMLGREVNIDEIKINPFLLRARVTGFSIEETNETDTFVAFEKLELDIGFWQTIFSFTPTLEHFHLIRPYAHLARVSKPKNNAVDDGTIFNFSDIIETLAQVSDEEAKPADQEQGDIPHIRLGEFRLEQGHISVADEVTQTKLNYEKLSFKLTNLDTLATTLGQTTDDRSVTNHYEFAIQTTERGHVHFDGQFQLSPIDIAGTVAVKNIAVASLWPLSDDIIDAKITDGLLSLLLNYHLSDDSDALRFRASDADFMLTNLVISDNTAPKVKLAELHINHVNIDTKTKRVDIDNIGLIAPWVAAYIDDRGIDLAAMFTPKRHVDLETSASAHTPSTPTSKEGKKVENRNQVQAEIESNSQHEAPFSWRVTLEKFALVNGDVTVNESLVSKGVYWRAYPISLTTGTIDSNFEAPINYKLAIKFAGETQKAPDAPTSIISSSGDVDVTKQHVSGSIDISYFNLSQIQHYLKPFVTLTLEDGNAALSGDFNADANGKIAFDGQANLSSLTIVDSLKQEPLLKWADMQADGIQYNSTTSTLSLEKITLEEPYAKLLITQDKKTNFGNIIIERPPKQRQEETALEQSTEQANINETDTASSAELAIRINEILVNNGSAYFADNSLRPRFSSSIESLNGNIASLSSKADTAAKVDLAGKIDGYAPVSLNGSINPLIENMFLDVNFTVNGAELTSVNPYSGTYMGHFIDKGLLSLDIHYQLENNQLAGNNHVVIDQLTLGRKTDSEQALSLPLELAIALLEDSNGVIDLGLEVSGDLDNPTFGFGSIILKAIGNLMTKAVTAPFSLLANLVGSDDDELNEIDFTNGSSQLTDAASSKLATLADALNKRPRLRVNIEGTVDDVSDAYALSEQKLQKQLLALSGEGSLPDNLSPSNMPVSGPIANALSEMFVSLTGKTVEDERLVVKARLQEGNTEETVPQEKLEQALYIALYNQVRNSIKVPKRDLANLAEARAKTVKTFLANGYNLNANRLFLLNSRQHLQLNKSGVALTLEAN